MPIQYLELENFKSYAGQQTIGPFHHGFTSIIGPNGSGKSNLMDSISFLLGVPSRQLRSTQLKDLIYRPPGDAAASVVETSPRTARATLVYQEEDTGEETRYSRLISSKGVGEYQINNKTVTFATYEESLSKIGIILKGRNFLVFQGDVESTAQKSPKELVQWLEQVSDSIAYKEEYDEALSAMNQADQEARQASDATRMSREEKRLLGKQKEEADKFQALVEKKRKTHAEFFLWKLYHVKKDVEEKEDDLQEMVEEQEEVKAELESHASTLRSAKKERSKASQATVSCEKKRVQAAAELDRIQPSQIQCLEERKQVQKKLSATTKKLSSIEADQTAHDQTLAQLETEIAEYTETEADLQAEYEEKKREATAGNVTLTEEQEAEYEQLRVHATVASAKHRKVVEVVKRRLGTATSVKDRAGEQVKELEDTKKEVKQRMEEFEERKTKLESVSFS